MKIVRIIDLPYRIKAMTSKDYNGDYNIYLNAKLDLITRQEAYLHELKHIERGDFDGGNIDEIERNTH